MSFSCLVSLIDCYQLGEPLARFLGKLSNSEYYYFYSSNVRAESTHSFKLQLSEGDLKFSEFDPFELYGF